MKSFEFRNSSVLVYIFTGAALFNFLMLTDTLWTSSQEDFELLYVRTNKVINTLFYGVITAIMVLATIKQNKINKQKNRKSYEKRKQLGNDDSPCRGAVSNKRGS